MSRKRTSDFKILGTLSRMTYLKIWFEFRFGTLKLKVGRKGSEYKEKAESKLVLKVLNPTDLVSRLLINTQLM